MIATFLARVLGLPAYKRESFYGGEHRESIVTVVFTTRRRYETGWFPRGDWHAVPVGRWFVVLVNSFTAAPAFRGSVATPLVGSSTPAE